MIIKIVYVACFIFAIINSVGTTNFPRNYLFAWLVSCGAYGRPVLLLSLVLFIRKFWVVYCRNQALCKLPVAESVHWILGGRAWYIIRQLSRGQSGLVEIPLDSLEISHRLGPIYVGFVGWVPFVAVQGGKEMRQICSASDGITYKKNFGYDLSKPLLGDSLLISSGAFWKHHRKIIDPAFGIKSLARATEIVETLISERMSSWNAKIQVKNTKTHCIDLFEEMNSLTADTIGLYTFSERFCGTLSASFTIVLTMLGLKIWQDALLPFVQYIPTPANIKYWFHLRRLKSRISELIQNRLQLSANERNEYSDILSLMLVENTESGDVSPKIELNQLRDECVGLIFAGHDTTASTLSWIFYLLAEHPEIQEKMRNELKHETSSFHVPPTLGDLEKLKYTGSVIKEVLRLYPPATIGRTSLRDTKIGEYSIPVGSEIFLNIFAMHRSKRYWGDNPDTFEPERFMKPLDDIQSLNYLPFGGAPRSCIGMKLAIIEMKIVLWRVLESFLLLPPSNGKIAKLLPSLTLHPIDIFIDLKPILND